MFETLRSGNMPVTTVPSAGTIVPLAQAQSGMQGRIVHLEESPRLRKRLADLGLAVGMNIRVLRASHARGPLILAVRNDTRLALGWSIAAKITMQVDR